MDCFLLRKPTLLADEAQKAFHDETRKAARTDEEALGEDLLEALDLASVPGELLDFWTDRGNRALEARGGRQAAPPMDLHVREASLRFLHHLTSLLGLPVHSWFDTVLCLDLYWLHGATSTGSVSSSVATLPATCVAIVAMLKKADSCEKRVNIPDYAILADQFARWLFEAGFEMNTVDMEQVLAQEQAVLDALVWQFQLPSVSAWTSKLCKRFDVISRGVVASSVDWVMQQMLTNARMVFIRRQTSSAMSPRKVANGLFVLGVVAARLVPLEAFRPDDLTVEEWEKLFAESMPQIGIPVCALPQERQEPMLEVLQVTTGGCSASELREDARMVAHALREMIQNSQTTRAIV